MKKLLVTLLIVTGFCQVTFAQNDPQAKKILDELSTKMKTYKGISADFSYTTKDRTNKVKGSTKGSIQIKGNKYFIKQGEEEIYSNGVKIWNYDGDAEVTVSEAGDAGNTMTPQKLLTNFYDKDFTYKLVSTTGNYNEIAMTPVDKRKNFKNVTLFVDKTKKMVTKARIVDKTDNTIEFALSNVNTAASLPDSRFVFDVAKHPGIEVIQ